MLEQHLVLEIGFLMVAFVIICSKIWKWDNKPQSPTRAPLVVDLIDSSKFFYNKKKFSEK